MGVWGTVASYATKAGGYLGTALDVGTKAAALYGTVQAFRSPSMPAPYAPQMPGIDPNAVTAMQEQADREGEEEKRRRAALYADKNQTIANKGGYAGLGPVVGGVGRKPTLLGGV